MKRTQRVLGKQVDGKNGAGLPLFFCCPDPHRSNRSDGQQSPGGTIACHCAIETSIDECDEWHTANRWRILCAWYAKLIGLLLQHWLIILFAWHDEQRSVVKLAHVVRDTACSLLEALSGSRSLCSVLQSIQRRMHSGCHMNKRKKHPNSAQLLQRGSPNWAFSPYVGAYGRKNVGSSIPLSRQCLVGVVIVSV
jgi:hypothetical protein